MIHITIFRGRYEMLNSGLQGHHPRFSCLVLVHEEEYNEETLLEKAGYCCLECTMVQRLGSTEMHFGVTADNAVVARIY